MVPRGAPLPNACRKQAEQEARAREVRLSRALEEVERFKALLQEVKAQVRVSGGGSCNLCSAVRVCSLLLTMFSAKADCMRVGA